MLFWSHCCLLRCWIEMLSSQSGLCEWHPPRIDYSGYKHTRQTVCLNLTQLRVSQGSLSWGQLSPPSDWLVALSVGNFLDCGLMWEGPAYCGWCDPWACGPGLCKKAGWEWARVSQLGSSICTCLSSCLYVSQRWKYNPKKPFPPHIALGHGVCQSYKVQIRTAALLVEFCTRTRAKSRVNRRSYCFWFPSFLVYLYAFLCF